MVEQPPNLFANLNPSTFMEHMASSFSLNVETAKVQVEKLAMEPTLSLAAGNLAPDLFRAFVGGMDGPRKFSDSLLTNIVARSMKR
jgi:hypothetical protein